MKCQNDWTWSQRNSNDDRQTPACRNTSEFVVWRRHPDLNRGSRICSPMPYHLAMAPSSGDARCAALSAAGLRPLAKSSAALPPPSSQIQNSRFVFVQGCGASRYINFCSSRNRKIGAGDEARTRYLHLGKVALYRMSYARMMVPPVGIEPTTRGFSVRCSTI